MRVKVGSLVCDNHWRNGVGVVLEVWMNGAIISFADSRKTLFMDNTQLCSIEVLSECR